LVSRLINFGGGNFVQAARPSLGAKGAKTRERILRVAERLFAERGYDGVSVRRIAGGANVQLALLTYYFHSKLGLYRAVFQRRIEPLSARRRELLHQLLRRASPPPTIEEVLDALARPWVELRDHSGGQHYSRLIAREAGDPRESSRGIVKEMLDPIAVEFLDAMERVLPGRSRSEVHWAYYFFIGALLLVLANPARMRRLSGDLCDVENSQVLIAAIVGFSVKALKEPPTAINKTSRLGETSYETRHFRVGRRRTTQRRPDRARSKSS
jgi:AcrR family transcriptional regulator